MSGLERIGDEVARELRRFPPIAGMASIVAVWTGAVGEAIARNAWPARLARDGTLHVATSSSAWAFELAQLEVEVRRRLATALGGDPAVAKLRFAPGRVPEPAAVEERAEAPPPSAVDQATAAEGARLAAPIGDESLREIVARAAAASLARAAVGRSV